MKNIKETLDKYLDNLNEEVNPDSIEFLDSIFADSSNILASLKDTSFKANHSFTKGLPFTALQNASKKLKECEELMDSVCKIYSHIRHGVEEK